MRHGIHPLSALSAAWLVGLLASEAVGGVSWRPGLGLAMFALAALISLWGALASAEEARRGCGRVSVAALALAAGAAGLAVPMREAAVPRPPPPGLCRLVAVVERTSALLDDQASSVVRVVRGTRVEDGQAIAAGTYLTVGPAALPAGATVRFLAKVAPRVPFRNPSPHPMPPPRFEVRGHAWVSDSNAIEVLSRSALIAAVEAIRARVRARLDQTLPARVAGVGRALVLGDDRALDAEDAGHVRSAGLLHVFAVSGLHVAILAGLLVAWLDWVLRWSPLAARVHVRRVACALGVPLVLVYAEVAGGSPSAWRAAVTAAVAWSVTASGRRPDPIGVSGVAVLVMGGLDPQQALRPAFLLSIVATSAILSAQQRPAADVRSWLVAAARLSARTTLATAPIALWYFGNVPLCGLLANVVLLPFGSLLLVQLSALHAIVCTMTPWGAVSAAPFVVVSDAFVEACAFLAGGWPALEWPVPDVAQGLVIATGAAALLLLRRLRARACVALFTALSLAGLELRLRARERPKHALRVTFLDVGQGDCALIDLPDGRAMLIDAGGNPGGGPDPGRAALVPLLNARRRARIDVAVLTHPHPDHYGGLAAVIDAIPIGEVWDSGQAQAEAELSTTSAEAARLLQRARTRGSAVLGPAELCGVTRSFGAARVRVLAPCPAHDSGHDPNDNSLVVRIDYGQRSFLFAGDAERHEETVLLGRTSEIRADVLKVGHHGSRTSTTPEFLRAVSPQLAIVSAGATNRFGHPHDEVLDRLKTTVRRLVRLDVEGGAVVQTDGRGLHLETWARGLEDRTH